MSTAKIVITPNVATTLKAFLQDVDEPLWGYLLCQRTGLSAGTMHAVLARLKGAGWVGFTDAGPASGGPARVTYLLTSSEIPEIRYAMAEAHQQRARTAAAQDRLRRPVWPAGPIALLGGPKVKSSKAKKR